MSRSGFEEGAVYEAQDVKGDVILVTCVEPADDESDQVHFVWLASDGERLAKYIGVEHRFSPDRKSFQRFKRVS
jgi:hypothetical protein